MAALCGSIGQLGAQIDGPVWAGQSRSQPATQLDQQTGHQDAALGMVIADMHSTVGMSGEGLGNVMRPTPDIDLQVR